MAARSKHFVRIKNKIEDSGDFASVVILHCDLDERDAFEIEKALIAHYGRQQFGGVLCNMTDGGEGVSGVMMSEQSRAKMSEAKKGKPGRPITPETRAKIGNAHRGKVISAEHRARVGMANSERKVSDTTRAKLSAVHKVRPKSAETRASMSAARLGGTLNEVGRKKISSFRRLAGPVSGFKGVSFHKASGKWHAVFLKKHLGSFDAPEKAARAYDAAAFAAWGTECYLNFQEPFNKFAE